MLYIYVKGKRFVKYMNRPKCKELIYHIKAQPECNGMLFATQNILKIEADRLAILNQLEGKNKEDL
jgi:hypothetical protein